MQIFVKNLSPSFEEMTFSLTSEICFTKFGITLFAIEINQEILINPKPDYKLPKFTRAYFIALDKDMVKRFADFNHYSTRIYNIQIIPSLYPVYTQSVFLKYSAFWYCLNCHSDVTDVKLIQRCKCLKGLYTFYSFTFEFEIFSYISVEDIVKQKHIYEMGLYSMNFLWVYISIN